MVEWLDGWINDSQEKHNRNKQTKQTNKISKEKVSYQWQAKNACKQSNKQIKQ